LKGFTLCRCQLLRFFGKVWLDAESTGFAAIATQQKVPNANPRSLESSQKQLIPTIERASE